MPNQDAPTALQRRRDRIASRLNYARRVASDWAQAWRDVEMNLGGWEVDDLPPDVASALGNPTALSGTVTGRMLHVDDEIADAEVRAAWDGWHAILTEGGESPTGAGLQALSEMEARLRTIRGEARDQENGRRAMRDREQARGAGLDAVERRDWAAHVNAASNEVHRMEGRMGALRVFLDLVCGDGVAGTWDQMVERFGPFPLGEQNRPEDVGERDHERTMRVGRALLAYESEGGSFREANNGDFLAWAATVADVSAETVRAAMSGSRIINGEGKSGSAGSGLNSRLEKLRNYVSKWEL